MSCAPSSRANKRYQTRILISSLIYGVTLVVASQGFKHHWFAGVVAWIAAILPALAICGMFVAIGLYLVEEQDEYLRMQMARQSLWASGFALSIATIYGFLENYGLVEHAEVYWVSVLWFLGLGLGEIANRLTIGRRS